MRNASLVQWHHQSHSPRCLGTQLPSLFLLFPDVAPIWWKSLALSVDSYANFKKNNWVNAMLVACFLINLICMHLSWWSWSTLIIISLYTRLPCHFLSSVTSTLILSWILSPSSLSFWDILGHKRSTNIIFLLWIDFYLRWFYLDPTP